MTVQRRCSWGRGNAFGGHGRSSNSLIFSTAVAFQNDKLLRKLTRFCSSKITSSSTRGRVEQHRVSVYAKRQESNTNNRDVTGFGMQNGM